MWHIHVDLQEAIRWENSPQINKTLEVVAATIPATGCSNYASEAFNLIANIMTADYPKHVTGYEKRDHWG